MCSGALNVIWCKQKRIFLGLVYRKFIKVPVKFEENSKTSLFFLSVADFLSQLITRDYLSKFHSLDTSVLISGSYQHSTGSSSNRTNNHRGKSEQRSNVFSLRVHVSRPFESKLDMKDKSSFVNLGLKEALARK